MAGSQRAAAIGARLQARRVELGLSKAAAGRLLQVSGQQWAKFEAGLNSLSADQVVTVCEAFGLSAEALLGLRPTTAPPGLDPEAAEQLRILAEIFRALPPLDRRELLRAGRMLRADQPRACDAAPAGASMGLV